MRYTINRRSYWVEDSGTGFPLVMLHGFTGSTRTFDETCASLDGDYRLIKVDLPGHGRTGPLGVVTMEQFCRDLDALFDALELERAAVLGYSLGGRAALSFAALYPERVEKLLLESASPGLETTEEQLARQAKDKTLAEMIRDKGIDAFVSYWENIPLFRTQNRLSQQAKTAIREERLAQDPGGLRESLLGMGTGHQPSWWERMSDLQMDVQLVVGALDEKFCRINDRMEKRIPEASYIVVEKAGHAIHLEKPKIFAKIVDGFMIK
ncbi:2-succinyl-6-hydroxy-2,4-cyclohexadiene-1-carboxylate synthase [Halobacillus sp. KGW1]|uniref:2-succinyl-6-hydroxy-2, 4-cyclohexadiene-1-carboxylate synthase n=1 Tax=Halobacillus sp. KGW1 TaxID=1793726 RepID=UPI0007863A9F|nr:2-succinyl-6-hydroxy-2,4-cyclohexadiene-1-carboxylate synthase [Halobacillus sp. KGW1]